MIAPQSTPAPKVEDESLRAENERLKSQLEIILATERMFANLTEQIAIKLGVNTVTADPPELMHAVNGMIAENERLTRELDEARAKQPINTHIRLFDLVRYQRSELHQAELITDEEYVQLCAGPMAMSPKGGSPSRQRLEDYDELRAELTKVRAALAASEGDKARLDWLELRKSDFHCTSDAIDFAVVVPASRTAAQHHAGPFDHATLRAAIDAAIATEAK